MTRLPQATPYLVALAAALVPAMHPGAAQATAPPASAMTRAIITSSSALDGSQRARLVRPLDLEVLRDIGVLRTTVVNVPTPAYELVRAQLLLYPGITDVARDPVARAVDLPTPIGSLPIPGLDLPPFLNGVLGVVPAVIGALPQRSGPDPFLDRQWGLTKVRAKQAWSTTEATPEQVVAVIDSGVDYNHLDLIGKVSPGHDWVTDDDDPMDPLLNFSHGTHVAGIIAANTSNSRGIAGIAPRARILAIRVLGTDNSGFHSDIASGIVEATNRGARIINLSLGGPAGSAVLEGAIAYAASRGVLLTCSTGNDSATSISFPAAYEGCFAVGASDDEDHRAAFSNTGAGIDLVAPGTNVLSLAPAQLYSEANGTSMAAPFVAGTAALLMSQGLSAASARDRLVSTSTDLGTRGYDTQFGWGRLDAGAATGATTAVHPPPGAPQVFVPGAEPGAARAPKPGAAPSPGASPSRRATVRIAVRQLGTNGTRPARCGDSQRRACPVRAQRITRFSGTASSSRSLVGRRVTIELCRRSGLSWKCLAPLRTTVRARGRFAFTVRPHRGQWRIRTSLTASATHLAARSAYRYATAR